jgi:hypothetical protein
MSAFEDKLRSKLAERAEQMPVEPDLADVHARIERQERGRDTRFNTAALLGAAAVVAVIIGLAVVMTRPEPRLINSATPSSSIPTLSDPVKNRLSIAAAFDRVFEATTSDAIRLGGIASNRGLQSVAAELRGRDPQRLLDSLRVHVDAVQFVPPSSANVDFAITSTEIPGKTVFSGQAVYEDDEWKISRATFCDVIAKVDVECPPAPSPTTTNPA